MREALRYLSQVEVPYDAIREHQDTEIRKEFARRLDVQLNLMGCTDARVQRWARELVELVEGADRDALRTDGLRLLSMIIMGAFGRLDDSGALRPLPLRLASDVEDSDEGYWTWCPSTMYAEAHPHIEVLLVGMAPAYAENKVGIPLVDYENLTRSDCMSCVNFERCFVGSVMVESGRPDFSIRVLGCDYSPSSEREIEARSARVVGMRCHTAGEVLRAALQEAMLVRPCWGAEVRGRQVVAAATNALRETTLTRSATGVRNGASDPEKVRRDAGWLWLEAALVRPKSTVLLGNEALEAYQICTGSKRKPSINPFDRHPVFGIVYKTFHPSYIMRRHGNRVIKPRSMVERLESTTFSRQSLMPGSPNHEMAALAHLIDVLVSARKVALQEHSLLEGIDGCADILPHYLLGNSAQ